MINRKKQLINWPFAKDIENYQAQFLTMRQIVLINMYVINVRLDCYI